MREPGRKRITCWFTAGYLTGDPSYRKKKVEWVYGSIKTGPGSGRGPVPGNRRWAVSRYPRQEANNVLVFTLVRIIDLQRIFSCPTSRECPVKIFLE
jgi:hypothetical protein